MTAVVLPVRIELTTSPLPNPRPIFLKFLKMLVYFRFMEDFANFAPRICGFWRFTAVQYDAGFRGEKQSRSRFSVDFDD